MTSSLFRRAGAELIGTFALVTAGCGAIVVNTTTGALTHVGVALTFGLIIMVMIAATGHLSGAHFNPAVTVAFALTPHFPWRDVPIYIGAQLLGAASGALTLRALFGIGCQSWRDSARWQRAAIVRNADLATAVLMFVIISVATDTRAVGEQAALAIGSAVALDAPWCGPISGASMNPARSFGPALIAGVWRDQWVYWVGPFVGAAIRALVYQFLRTPSDLPHEMPQAAASDVATRIRTKPDT